MTAMATMFGRALPVPAACTQTTRRAWRQTLRYLARQRAWLGDYAAWQQQGYPVGSGLIERAVAIVINLADERTRHALATRQRLCDGGPARVRPQCGVGFRR